MFNWNSVIISACVPTLVVADGFWSGWILRIKCPTFRSILPPGEFRNTRNSWSTGIARGISFSMQFPLFRVICDIHALALFNLIPIQPSIPLVRRVLQRDTLFINNIPLSLQAGQIWWFLWSTRRVCRPCKQLYESNYIVSIHYPDWSTHPCSNVSSIFADTRWIIHARVISISLNLRVSSYITRPFTP